MAIVEFKNVSRIYTSGEHELKALDGVDMKLEKGKFVVILGPSGAGKSTLLNMLGGLDSPTSGKIYVKGKDISRLSKDELADYRAATVGFVFQFYNLIPTLTVQENVALVREISPDSFPAEKMLERLSQRVKDFSEKGMGFPHEIGMFLGYPVADIRGFIENEGRKYLMIGYWKVYSNLSQARMIFKEYDRAKECAVQEYLTGKSIREISMKKKDGGR